MKNRSTNRFVKLIVVLALSTPLIGLAQKGESFVTLRLPLQHTWYTVDVTIAADPSARGPQKGKSIQSGIHIGYEYYIKNKLSVEVGAGISTAIFNIVRNYNIRYMGSLLAHNPATYPNYRYSLLQVPLRIGYRIKKTPKLEWMIGATNLLNFTWKQHYGKFKDYATSQDLSKRNLFYLFSNTVQLHSRVRYKIGPKLYVGAEPTLQIYNQWKKDEVLYDFGPGFRQARPEGVAMYNKQFLGAVGIACSFSYQL